MKKIIIALIASTAAPVFADTFQEFNNNLYAQYSYVNYHQNGTDNGSVYANGFGIGGTFQNDNNIWANASINKYKQMQGGPARSMTNVRAGYAFQFFGDDDNGFQVIPYASFGATDSADYSWGAGIQPEYRLMSSLKVSTAIGFFGYNGAPSNASAQTFGGDNCGCNTVFAFNVNPEIQYDIDKTVMVSAGYNFATPFNAQNSISTNGVTAKVGYLF